MYVFRSKIPPWVVLFDAPRPNDRGVTSSFFGIGILPVSDLLDFRYFGRYRSPLFVYFPPFLPPFFQKGVELLKKGASAPLLRKKGGTAPFLIPKCTDRVFLRYRYGNYREIPTEYRPKIPIRDTTLIFSPFLFFVFLCCVFYCLSTVGTGG